MKKILVVEDNPINMKLFCDILEVNNYDVEKATDGLEALDRMKNRKYDLVVLDIQLPKMDGFSVLEKLKEEERRIPKVVVASAFAMDKDKQKAKMLGCVDYITKPIDIFNFLNTIKNLLGE